MHRPLPADEPARACTSRGCHDALDQADALVVNPGAWTHYSWAIHDALEMSGGPVVEVHLSNVDEREEWRRFSVLEEIATHRVIGKGPDGYREALEYLSGRRVSRARPAAGGCSRSRCSSRTSSTSAT